MGRPKKEKKTHEGLAEERGGGEEKDIQSQQNEKKKKKRRRRKNKQNYTRTARCGCDAATETRKATNMGPKTPLLPQASTQEISKQNTHT